MHRKDFISGCIWLAFFVLLLVLTLTLLPERVQTYPKAVSVAGIALSVLLLSLDGKDMVTNFTAVIATFNNIGPGLELVGPTQNYASLGILSKLVLSFDMIAGRLELFPVLLLFSPRTYRN